MPGITEEPPPPTERACRRTYLGDLLSLEEDGDWCIEEEEDSDKEGKDPGVKEEEDDGTDKGDWDITESIENQGKDPEVEEEYDGDWGTGPSRTQSEQFIMFQLATIYTALTRRSEEPFEMFYGDQFPSRSQSKTDPEVHGDYEYIMPGPNVISRRAISSATGLVESLAISTDRRQETSHLIGQEILEILSVYTNSCSINTIHVYDDLDGLLIYKHKNKETEEFIEKRKIWQSQRMKREPSDFVLFCG